MAGMIEPRRFDHNGTNLIEDRFGPTSPPRQNGFIGDENGFVGTRPQANLRRSAGGLLQSVDRLERSRRLLHVGILGRSKYARHGA
jgi:hypothetical protein